MRRRRREATDERREKREISTSERSSGWREVTSWRNWASRRRIAWWRRSAVEFRGDVEDDGCGNG